MIEFDHFQLTGFTGETNAKRVETRAKYNEALETVGHMVAATALDPSLSTPVVVNDARQGQTLQETQAHPPRIRSG